MLIPSSFGDLFPKIEDKSPANSVRFFVALNEHVSKIDISKMSAQDRAFADELAQHVEYIQNALILAYESYSIERRTKLLESKISNGKHCLSYEFNFPDFGTDRMRLMFNSLSLMFPGILMNVISIHDLSEDRYEFSTISGMSAKNICEAIQAGHFASDELDQIVKACRKSKKLDIKFPEFAGQRQIGVASTGISGSNI